MEWETKTVGFSLASLVGYGFLTGWHTAVSRAIVMSGCALSERCIGRVMPRVRWPGGHPHSRCSAFAIWAEGFWLSLATAALVALAEPMQNHLKDRFPFLPTFVAPCFRFGNSNLLIAIGESLIAVVIRPCWQSAGCTDNHRNSLSGNCCFAGGRPFADISGRGTCWFRC